MRRISILMLLLAGVPVGAQDDDPRASEGWVELPSGGDTTAAAFAVVRNPGMYDVYLVSAASEVAEKVELRQDGDEAELRVPAYGKLTMKPDGPHLVLVDLKRTLEENEVIPLTVETDGNVELRFEAVVRKP